MSENNDGYVLDEIDKRIINCLQKGFPVCSRPYAEAAVEIGVSEDDLISRIKHLLDQKFLTRFGPMYDAVEFGGGLTLAAMTVPENMFDSVNDYLNTVKEVAHNYEREHVLNMWFVLGTERQDDIEKIIRQIEKNTGLVVYNMPKLHSFFVNLYLPVQ